MKKLIALVLTGLLVLSGCSSSSSSTGSGEATVSVKGFKGNMDVTVTLTDGAISAVKVDGPNESEEFGQKAIAELPEKMVKANSADVDGYTGATGTSDAIKKAVKAALFEIDPSHKSADINAWTDVKGYVKAEDYNLVPGSDSVTGASYKTEVEAQKENNLLTQEESKELALDYLRGFVMYYDLADGANIDAERIYVQSNIDLFEYLNAHGSNYQYGDSFTGKNNRIYTYSLPATPLDVEDYVAAIQLGDDTKVSNEQFISAIGEPYYSYREMYAIGTSYNNMPGLAESEAVLDPESMMIYMGSNPGSEKSLELAANPNIKMYWVHQIPESHYVAGGSPKDNDYYHSYGVRVEGTAGAVDMKTVIDEKGNVLRPSVVRGGIRYGMSISGAEEWFAGKPDADMDTTARMLAETRYYADDWATMSDADKDAAQADVRAYMANVYLGNINESNMKEVDAAELAEMNKDAEKPATIKKIMDPFMNRSGEGYALRLAATGSLLEVNVNEFLTNTLWSISDCSTQEQVDLYVAGDNPIMAKWAPRFFELYQNLDEGQQGTQIRRQVYYPNEDSSLDR